MAYKMKWMVIMRMLSLGFCKAFFVSAVVLSLVGCGGGGGGDADESLGGQTPTNSDVVVSSEIQGLYSDFAVDDDLLCESDSENALVGCYVSENCVIDGGDSRLFLLDVRSNGSTLPMMYLYQGSTSCTGGTRHVVNISALGYQYAYGDEVVSESGPMVTELNATLRIGGFTSNYFSSYHLDGSTLCFPDPDYSWDGVTGGLSFTETDVLDRPTNIDFDTCLLRITE